MALACKLCIASGGLRGIEMAIAALPRNDEELFRHLESEHHIAVQREGETAKQCRERFLRENPEAADRRTCKCPECAEWRAAMAMGRVVA